MYRRLIREAGAPPRVCLEPMGIMDGVVSTGVIGKLVKEHALVLNVEGRGLVVLTGCSHPGLLKILNRAREATGIEKIHGVMGGFHIMGLQKGIEIGEKLKELGVDFVSPCHCTALDAKMGIGIGMGKKGLIGNGAGRVIMVQA